MNLKVGPWAPSISITRELVRNASLIQAESGIPEAGGGPVLKSLQAILMARIAGKSPC